MKRITFLSLVIFSAFVFAGCPAEPTEANSEANPAPMSEAPMQTQSSDDSRDVTDGGSKQDVTNAKRESKPANQIAIDKENTAANEPSKPIERKIIRNAELQLESSSPDEVHQKITAIAENKKGFVVQSRKSSSQTRNRGGETVTMSIRVPSEQFNETLTDIRKTANRVLTESVTGKDVTEEFIDIEARLKAKKALEERFLEIMQNAKSVQDALNVQRELANVRGEIEQIEGRKRFLENQASLSTINISIQPPTAISGSTSGFFYELKEAVSDGFDAALAFILILIRVLIALIPFLLLVVLPLFLLLRYFWRHYKKKRLAKKFVDEMNADAKEVVIEHTEDEN
ncbi:MAG: DUF4349 domain-containing protein [Acidobacteria bacterium]|nr:DUF4349 domain-containing protein [Acidobacteriota bacterium]